MTTPIVDFVKRYSDKNALRLHMPGHKGKGILGVEHLDITEIDGADVLYSSKGIIAESEANATALFGTAKTLYSTEGSSLCIRAMLQLTKTYAKAKGESAFILAGRNAHKTFLTAAALLDIDVDWLTGDGIMQCSITADILEDYLSSVNKKPAAVYITSPDYLGNITDISALSGVCKKHGILLLVDNAHGAYLRFLGADIHPITLGADICCDSAHKTLPVLTGGAYLHISKTAPDFFVKNSATAMSLFASTSPSYLILQSLDMANRYLADGYREKLCAFAERVSALKKQITDKGFSLMGNEPLKITIAPKGYGYEGSELARVLASKNIECEFSDPDYTVLMLTPEIEDGLDILWSALCETEQKTAINTLPPKLGRAKRVMPLSKAMFSPFTQCSVDNCLGKILAAPSVTCPPAVPIVISGEEIDEQALACLKYYGINTCLIVDGSV